MQVDVPPSLQQITHYVKLANENVDRDPVLFYWCLYYAVKAGMSVDKSSPESMKFFTSTLSTLEEFKKKHRGEEAITQDFVAQAHIENIAVKLFEFADQSDRKSVFTKNVVKAFYTAGHLIDVLTIFGELDETLTASRKYAKWKAAYIHTCLKNGEAPKPGPARSETSEENESHEETGTSYRTNIKIEPADEKNYYPGFSAPHAVPRQPIQPMINEQIASDRDDRLNEHSRSGLTVNDFMEAQKHAKYALSALTYEDAKTAIESMQEAIKILTKYD